ncbi:dihydrofolate reductase family protein [Streptomyces sp. NPDC055025]
MRRLFPVPAPVPIGRALPHWLAREYAYPGAKMWVRGTMVTSLDGAAAWEGRSGGLSSAADRALFAVLRALADVILVGAGTARREAYGPAEAHPDLVSLRAAEGQGATPAIAVVSTTLEGIRPELLRDGRTVVITSRSARPELRRLVGRRVEVLPAGDYRVDMGQALRLLTDRGFTRVLAEGGPHTLGQLQAGGHVNELCLTVSPLLVAGSADRIAHGTSMPLRGMELVGLLEDEGHLFTRYQAT